LAKIKPISQKTVFRPDKRLGQNFLKNSGIINHIIDLSGFDGADHILEVGPGKGALTIPLAGVVRHITAVEKDHRLISDLEDRFLKANIDNVSLINNDILRFDISTIAGSQIRKLKVIGNLPYNISSPFVEMLIKNQHLVSKAVLMFQLEFARRIAASPGSKAYGAMSVLVQYNAEVRPLFQVSKEEFRPVPKVGSMVVVFDMEKPHPRRADNYDLFKRVVKGGFAHRRKTVINSLKGSLQSFNSESILCSLEKCGIDPKRRAETLSIDDFIDLTSALKDFKSSNP